MKSIYLVALLGLEQGRAGETLVSFEDHEGAVGFESIKYISDPVLTVAVEPKKPTDLPRLIDALQKLSIQDPNLVATINQETGEYLLSGMGELHLEIAIKDLGREHRLDVTATEPTVVYRETIQHAVGPFMGKSPNKHNRVWFDIEPLEPVVIDLIKDGELSELSSRRQREEALHDKAGWSTRDARRIVSVNANANMVMPPSGFIQGVYADVGATRGVHYAPANVVLNGVIDLTYNVSDGEQDLLNPVGINVIRSFQGEGIRVWGARTLTSFKDGRHYVNVRRELNYIKESLRRGLRFAIFELNEQSTWETVRQACDEFLRTMFNRGQLFSPDGSPERAYFVKCDEEINPTSERREGRMNVEIGVNPPLPAEFLVVRVGLWDGGTTVEEELARR